MQTVDIFKALGESTRLKMVERLSKEGSQTLTSLSNGLSTSRQGIRKHVQILEDAEIVLLTQKGRTTIVTLDQRALDISKKFITKLEFDWNKKLKVLKDFVEKNN